MKMNGPLPSKYRMNPQSVTAPTPVIANNLSPTTIIYPAANPEYRILAERLELTVFQTTGVHLKLKSDTVVLPYRHSRLPDKFRPQPLILLVCLNTNRVLLPLNAGYYCAADVVYPGEDDHELRTVVNPTVRVPMSFWPGEVLWQASKMPSLYYQTSGRTG